MSRSAVKDKAKGAFMKIEKKTIRLKVIPCPCCTQNVEREEGTLLFFCTKCSLEFRVLDITYFLTLDTTD